MNKTFEVKLWDETHTLTIPDLPPDAILPGAFRGDMLVLFNSFLGDYPLKTMEECAADRAANQDHWWAWAQACYTWNHLLREGPHLGIETTARLIKLLFDRDLNRELNGGLLDMGEEPNWMHIFGMPTKEEYFATLIITAARFAWWNRVQQSGLPDPKVDPMPPIYQSDRMKVNEVYKQRIKPFISEYFTSRGYNRELPAITALILYVMGYIAEKPDWLDLPDDIWHAALQGFIRPPHAPFIWMLRYPGEYLNTIAEEGHEGKHNGFFSTPTNVTRMMAEMIGATKATSTNNGHYQMVDDLWQCTVPGETADERRSVLGERVSDPCVGGGNMIWGFINQWIFGEFIDINPSLVNATRAMCAMHAPWFVHSVIRANALTLVPANTEAWEDAVLAQRQGILDQIRAERTLAYYITLRAGVSAAPNSIPAPLQVVGIDESQLYAHIEARAQARLADRRKEFAESVYSSKLEALRMLLQKDASIPSHVEAEPQPKRTYDHGTQPSLFP